ncbi:MAG: T9SS type A sorting domain-containing protein [Ignavibacteriales bacterium]|nr:T9SS type A sorting domain-containing protein [Ignavibacteriales bacterium]
MKYYFKIIVFALLTVNSFSFAQGYGSWFATDSMIEKRRYHAGIQLDNGNILITGGYGVSGPASNGAEIFNITNFKWGTAISMNKGRGDHNLVKLNDGSILAIGGYSEKTCEILDKNLTNWIFTDSLKMSRWYGQSVVIMQNGNVMIIGGYKGSLNDPSQRAIKECEIYNYSGKFWEITSELNIGRFGHTATVLKDERVIVIGGNTINNGVILLNSCEIFNPITKSWTTVAPMHYSRAGHSATLLSNGKVLVVGGKQAISELYNPSTDTWEEVGPVMLASGHNNAVILSNEKFLLLVHDIIGYAYNPGWELYSLENLESVYWGKFKRLISDPVVVKIDDNRVLFSGGYEFIEEYSLYTAANLSQVYDLNLTSVKESIAPNISPNDFSLSCYPNPFNSSTNITFELSSPSYVSLKVFNIIGAEINTIYNGELSVGRHTFRCEMNNFSSGVYFVKMNSQKQTKLIKIILQK